MSSADRLITSSNYEPDSWGTADQGESANPQVGGRFSLATFRVLYRPIALSCAMDVRWARSLAGREQPRVIHPLGRVALALLDVAEGSLGGHGAELAGSDPGSRWSASGGLGSRPAACHGLRDQLQERGRLHRESFGSHSRRRRQPYT